MIDKNLSVWFLTGSQGLYGPETLAQVEQQSRAIVDQLNDAGTLPLPVGWQPVVTDSTAIHKVIQASNADSDCVGLIAWMHTFSPAKMWITGLDALKTPLLHLHTQANRNHYPTCRSPAPSGNPSPTWPQQRRPGSPPAAPTTPCCPPPSTPTS